MYPFLIWMNVIDKPNARSSHVAPTVRGLGVGIICSILTTWGIFGLFGSNIALTMSLTGIFLASISFLDDLKPLSPSIRFVCHVLVALTLLGILFLTIGILHLTIYWMLLPIGFLFSIGYINAFNFMDGINGLAGFQGLLTGIGTALILYLSGLNWNDPVIVASLVIAGACAGFLPLNFPKPIGFMGDVASATLGYWLAGIVLWAVFQHGWYLLIPLSLLHANFILDTSITLIRRKLRGEKLSQAHREHFYQRLVRSGKSHAFVTSLEAIGQIATVVLMSLYLWGDSAERCIIVSVVFLLWLSFFFFVEKKFKKYTMNK